MRVAEESEHRLVLKDTQFDKKLGIGIPVFVLLVMAILLVADGAWLVALIPVLLAAGALVYLKLTLLGATVTFDRAIDQVTLSVTSRKGSEDWRWRLSDIVGAEVSGTGGSVESGGGRKRPVIVLKDGTRVPIRPYYSAGSQSWSAVIAIRRFVGQDKVDDLPVGWIPDE